MPARPFGDRHGFTLIEILAVVLIIGLTFGLFLPNLDAARAGRLRDRGRDVAALLHIARERAVVTGAAHRVWLDVDAGAMRIDWFVDEERAAEALGEEPILPEPPSPTGGRRVVDLSPPRSTERDYYPIPSRFGETTLLPVDYYFVGVETPDGFVEVGEVQLVFGRDGTTDYAEIVLADAWDNEVVLEVQPLMDHVRIHRSERR